MREALGPFLNVFLVTQRHWSQTSVGQAPIGAAIDATRAYRGLVIASLVVQAAERLRFTRYCGSGPYW